MTEKEISEIDNTELIEEQGSYKLYGQQEYERGDTRLWYLTKDGHIIKKLEYEFNLDWDTPEREEYRMKMFDEVFDKLEEFAETEEVK